MKTISGLHKLCGLLLGLLALAGLAHPRAVRAAAPLVVTNTNDSGAGSLRQALLDANAAAGADTIEFNIPGAGVHTLAPASPLPALSGPVTLDGYTQPGSQPNSAADADNAVVLVELNGANAGAAAGLVVTGGGSVLRGLAVNGWTGDGIRLESDGNRIEGCRIGTDPAGLAARPNSANGIVITGAANNVVGGTAPAARNLISGNGGGQGLDDPQLLDRNGILITGAGAIGNQVQGNLIGTDATGKARVPNTRDGVRLLGGAHDNLIGGESVAARNVIAGNQDNLVPGPQVGSEVRLSGQGTDNNRVQGNFLGADVTGLKSFATCIAVTIDSGAANNLVGGPRPAGSPRGTPPGNVIWDGADGVDVGGFAPTGGLTSGGPGNTLQGNLVGAAADETFALGKGNDGEGIYVNSTLDTTIDDNLIAGSAGDGVCFANTSSGSVSGNVLVLNGNEGVCINSNVTVSGNLIGTDATGANLGNLLDGVGVFQQGGNVIQGNTIAFNNSVGQAVAAGVRVIAGGAAIAGNSVYANTGLGIDLNGDGVTPNDAGDADTGPNALQNYPVLTSAVTSGAAITVRGTLNSTPGTTFTLEFFRNQAQDPSGHGEGETPLGQSTAMTDGAGNVAFTANLPAAVAAGRFISATATDPNGNTSEFSADVAATAGGDTQPPTLSNCSVAPASLPSGGGAVTLGVDATDDVAVRSVTATVTLPGGGTQAVTLALQTVNHYAGAFNAPANTGNADQSYTVRYGATDTSNNAAAPLACGGFTVAAPAAGSVTLTNCDVQPRALPAPGGDVALSVDVGVVGTAGGKSGVRGVSLVVRARVTRPNGTVSTVNLQSGGKSSTFSGTFTAPANTTTADQVYRVQNQGSLGAQAPAVADCGSFTVAGIPISGQGRLQARPNPLNFEQVQIGRTASRVVTLKNVGDGPLDVTVGAVRGAFTARAAQFTLDVGESRKVVVRFHPRHAGRARGRLPVQASQGNPEVEQAGGGVTLLGSACQNNPFK